MPTRAIFQAHVDGATAGVQFAETLPFVWQWSFAFVSSPFKRETLVFGPGTQTLTIPQSTTLIIINPSVTTAATLKVGSNAATIATDGWEISHSVPTIMTVAGLTARILYASLAVAGLEITYLG